MKRFLMIGLILAAQAFGSVPQPDPVASTDEFGHVHIEWQSVVGRTYFPRVSTDMVNWSYLPGEVFLGDGSVLQGVSFPPPLNDQTFVSLHFTDEAGAHLLSSDTDRDGFTLQEELDNDTDPTIFDGGGGGTGYPAGDGPPNYIQPPEVFYKLNIDITSPNKPREIVVIGMDFHFRCLTINGQSSVGGLPYSLNAADADQVARFQIEGKEAFTRDRSLRLVELQKYQGENGEVENLYALRNLKIPKGFTLSDAAIIEGGLPGTDQSKLIIPVEFQTYSNSIKGPGKPHLRNLDTRRDEDSIYGKNIKLTSHIWDGAVFRPGEYLQFYNDNNSPVEVIFNKHLRWRVTTGSGQTIFIKYFGQYYWELRFMGKPAEDDFSYFKFELMKKDGFQVLDQFGVTVLPASTKNTFETWHTDELADMAWLQTLPPVFSWIDTNPDAQGYLPRPDANFNPFYYGVPHSLDKRFHPDASYEQRSYATSAGHGHQVCFDENGVIITEGVSAGSADRAAAFPANLWPYTHVTLDVDPFIRACQLDGNPVFLPFGSTDIQLEIGFDGFEGGYIKDYFEVRPAIPNNKPQLEPGDSPQ